MWPRLYQYCADCFLSGYPLWMFLSLRSPWSLFPHQLTDCYWSCLWAEWEEAGGQEWGALERKLLRKPCKPSCCLIRPDMLSGPGPVSWRSLCMSACVYLFSSQADYLVEQFSSAAVSDHWIIWSVIFFVWHGKVVTFANCIMDKRFQNCLFLVIYLMDALFFSLCKISIWTWCRRVQLCIVGCWHLMWCGSYNQHETPHGLKDGRSFCNFGTVQILPPPSNTPLVAKHFPLLLSWMRDYQFNTHHWIVCVSSEVKGENSDTW